jgi:hypothetical protein
MRMLRATTRKLFCLSLAAYFCTGCGPKGAMRSSGETKAGAREVKFSVDGNGAIFPGPKSTTVTFSLGEVVVEESRVLLNGVQLARMPAEAKVVNVDYTDETLTITADDIVLVNLSDIEIRSVE